VGQSLDMELLRMIKIVLPRTPRDLLLQSVSNSNLGFKEPSCCIFVQISNLYHRWGTTLFQRFVIAASKTVSELLGCSIEDLNLALSKRHMKVNNENIVQKLTLSQVGFLN
jgi:hypothetical protein